MITLHIHGKMPDKCTVNIEMVDYRKDTKFSVYRNNDLEFEEYYEHPYMAYNALQACLSTLFYALGA